MQRDGGERAATPSRQFSSAENVIAPARGPMPWACGEASCYHIRWQNPCNQLGSVIDVICLHGPDDLPAEI